MKVLYVCSGQSPERISPVVAAQVRSLVAEGVEADLFAIGGKGTGAYMAAIFRLRKHLKNRAYDCIHAHYGLCGIVALLARRGNKLVVSFMGDDLLGSRREDGSLTVASRLMKHINIVLSNRFYNHTIVKSAGMLHPCLRRTSVKVIPNGVDTGLFTPGDRTAALGVTGWRPEKRHLIFVSDPGRKEKNFSLAQSAVALMGRDDTELHAVTGVAHNLMPAFYNSADTLLLTSFHEGSANVIKEAMACNCPVVSTDTGDALQVTGDAEGCYVVPCEREAIAQAVNRAIDFRMMRGASAGRSRIIEAGLDSVTVAKRIVTIYNEVTG